ncbi:hypothetical protein [Nonlabens dokdonensis]|nr:hypothetical protein [Nonlabens dokdonensis]
MKKSIFTILMLSTIMIACKDNDKETDDLAKEQSVAEADYENNDDYNTTAVVTYNLESAEEMADEARENVTMDKNNMVSLKNFTSYGELQNNIKNLSIDPNKRDKMQEKKAIESFNYFVSNMPNYLKTDLIMKEVEDARMAMKKLEKDLNDETTSSRVIKKHIQNVKDKVTDLNNEIVDMRLSLDKQDLDYAAYSDFVNNVNYNDVGVITIVDFDNYRQFQDDYNTFNQADAENQMKLEQSLSTTFNEMVATMPNYLKIDDVMDALDDIRKEIKEYETEINDPSIDNEEHLENLEEIDEAMYDFNKELLKARKKFDEENLDLLENYMESLNEGLEYLDK